MTTFEPVRATRITSIRLNCSPEQAFPLFSPLGERAWAEGWDPAIIWPLSGEPQVDAVFTTQHHGEPPAVWIISAFDPDARHIAYVRVAPQSVVTTMRISCFTNDDGTTNASIAYTYTGLSVEGNHDVETMTEHAYRRWILSWEREMNRYLQAASVAPRMDEMD